MLVLFSIFRVRCAGDEQSKEHCLMKENCVMPEYSYSGEYFAGGEVEKRDVCLSV